MYVCLYKNTYEECEEILSYCVCQKGKRVFSLFQQKCKEMLSYIYRRAH